MITKLLIKIGGARRDRTDDLLRARQALSQLSYGPFNLQRVILLAKGTTKYLFCRLDFVKAKRVVTRESLLKFKLRKSGGSRWI